MDTHDLLKAMEETRNAIAAITGMKQQLLDNGWSEPGAEQLVITLINQGGKNE